MTIDTNIVQYLEVLLNVAFAVLPTLVALAIMFPVGKFVIRFVVDGWAWFRPNVDEPTDSFVLALAHFTGRTPEEVIAILTGNMDKLRDILLEGYQAADATTIKELADYARRKASE